MLKMKNFLTKSSPRFGLWSSMIKYSMTNKISQRQIKKVADRIVQEYKPEKIILFGSHAWGEPNPDSDVDLFIVKKSKKRQIDRMRELRMKLI